MKIFISHASANKEYGNALVELLRGVGVKEDEIVFTSNTAYGIPISQNIFTWLKTQIINKPLVIYLLSKEYYQSIACLNEMGAAWVIENEHAIIFTPDFDISSKEFRNGAIDPREMGFYLNDKDKLFSFIQYLNSFFTITTNVVIINQKINYFLAEVENVLKKEDSIIKGDRDFHTKNEFIKFENASRVESYQVPSNIEVTNADVDLYSKFLFEIRSEKLKEEELILISYLNDTGRSKFKIGWQMDVEQANIKCWEEIKNIDSVLSRNYESAFRKLELRGYTEVFAYTGSGNPKELKLKSEIESHIIDLPTDVLQILSEILKKNPVKDIKSSWRDNLTF
jgi:hypothetical protein